MDLSVPVRLDPAAAPGAANRAALEPAGHTSTGPADPSTRRGVPPTALAIASGLVLYLAFPPGGLWPVAPVAVAMLVLACREVSVRRAALLGLLHGLALFLPLVEWTATLAGLPALVALSLLQSVFLAGLGAAVVAVSRAPGWPVWTAALWVAEEAVRSRLPFGGFTWGRLAFSQGDSALTPLAALGGAPLVTFAVALLGGALASAWLQLRARGSRPPSSWPRRLLPALLAAAVLVPAVLLGRTGPPPADDAPPLRVAIVQGNVPRLGLGFNDQRAAVLTNHVEATRELAADVRAGRTERPDLVLWPENASDLDPLTDPEAAALVESAVQDVGVPVLVGALLQGPGDGIRNAGVLWDPTTGPGQIYVKRKLVPFGEYVPLRSVLAQVTDLVRLVPRDFVSGDEPGVLEVAGGVRLGDLMCYEIAFDGPVRDVVRGGAQLLAVQTNNATFGFSAQTEQQLAMGRLRAVEHGRAVLVAATSGISAVVGADGSVRQRAELFTQEVLVADVPVRSELTLATRLGLLPEVVLTLLGLAALGLVRVRR